jgi:hypothetical protein
MRSRPLSAALVALTALCLAVPAAAQNLVRVPQDARDLQAAISRVSDGGVIEMAAGVYPAPTRGFDISGPDVRKTFTIRPAAGAAAGSVILDGQGARTILRFQTANRTGKTVTVQGITFRNGVTTTEGQGGAITVNRADVQFVSCSFLDNSASGTTTGGGAGRLFEGATVTFRNSTFARNSSRHRAGALEIVDATVTIEGGLFADNRVNLPGHDGSSAGGAIFLLHSKLEVTGARFERNEAGYTGGALFIFGAWAEPLATPRTEATITSSTFVANRAVVDPASPPPGQTSGGAIHVEDQATVRVRRSLFIKNSAEFGGAIDTYRGLLEVQGSAFLGNSAPLNGSVVGAGGAIFASSADFNDSSTGSGAINRRPARVEISDTLLRGRFEEVGATAHNGGCLFAAGDTNRVFGGNGVTPMGTPAENRATVVVRASAFFDCDVQRTNDNRAGAGGALFVDVADLSLTNSLVLDSNAVTGTGALEVRRETAADTSGTTFGNNGADRAGGGLVAAPPSGAGAAGGALPPTLVYAWNGRSATLDGQPLASRSGLVTTSFGEHRLVVDGVQVASARAVPASCTAGTVLCLGDDRFKLEVAWKNGAQSGAGQAVSLTRDTGYFWFFGPENIELVIKVIDGRGLNSRFWVFFGALTNLEYTLKVTDTATGRVKNYRNPAGRIASVADTDAFPDSAVAAASAADAWTDAEQETEAVDDFAVEDLAVSAGFVEAPAATLVSRASCAPSPTQLCFDNGRLRATLTWSANGQNGVGQAVQVTGDTGYFTFFDPNNVELMVKVLNAGVINNFYWVFYGALSNVQYTLTVTDTQTNRTKTYSNPQGTLASKADTAALMVN